jgi:hypothetical protein
MGSERFMCVLVYQKYLCLLLASLAFEKCSGIIANFRNFGAPYIWLK